MIGVPRLVARISSLTPVPGLTAAVLVTAQPPAEMSNMVPSRIAVCPIAENKICNSTGILGCSRHSIMAGSGRQSAWRRSFEEFDGDGLLLHLFHKAHVGHVANDTGELCAVVTHNAGPVNDDIIDQPVPRDMHEAKIDMRIDLLAFELSLDLSEMVFALLAQIGDLFVRMFVDSAGEGIPQELNEQSDKLPLLFCTKPDQGAPRARFAISS